MIVIKTLHQAALVVLAVMLQSVFVDTSQHQKVVHMVFLALGGAFTVAVIHVLFKGMSPTPVDSVLLFLRVVVTVSKAFVLFVMRGCTTKFPTWSLRFELLHAILHTCTDTYGDRMVLQHHAQWIRVQSDVVGSILGWFACHQHNRRHETVQFNGLEHLWLRNKQPRPTGVKRLVVLYLHGGGFAVLSPRLYTSLGATLASTIEKELGKLSGNNHQVDLLLGNYRKAPEFRFPTQPEDATALYTEYLLKQEGLSPSQIILAGDSAGGGLVMSTLLRLRDSKPQLLPRAAMLLSPAVDLTGDEPDAPDCFLARAMCQAFSATYHPDRGDPTKWGDASSAQCDLRGLSPVFLQTGTLDFIFQHGARLAAKAKADGVSNLEVDAHDGMPHVFSLFPSFVLPYAHVGVQRLAVFAATHFLKSEARAS
ncbi:hypothetical protein V7S43_009725 [Phytophthora oleae]|uniref:Alpha/beta hydrolase fold-3 domain-containing protein n=1 Tax=Phytophthora oleae TaxID=2107226 RepID=A0ABD3FGS6_9STRA